MDDDFAQYEVDIDLANPNTSHAQVARLVGSGRRVLDVGCWTGDLGRVLVGRGCRVTGVEIDPEAAEKARSGLDEVVVLDLDRELVSQHFLPESFDVVVMADVLEHLLDPGAVLSDVVSVLAPGGRVVASIPNVTHGSIRLALLRGDWTYTDVGLLDRTHLRFFDRAGVRALFEDSGYLIDDLRGTTADPLSVEVAVNADALPDPVVEWVRDQSDALVYQFVLAAHPGGPDEAQPLEGLILHPAEPDDRVRVADRHTQRHDADIEARHRLLTVRDHVIGLEAATATAEARADQAERQLKGARKRLDRKNQRIAQLTRQARRTPPSPAPMPAGLPRRVLRRLRSRRAAGT